MLQEMTLGCFFFKETKSSLAVNWTKVLEKMGGRCDDYGGGVGKS